MARVVACIPDLLFGSQVQGALRTAGHEVELVADEESLRRAVAGAEVLIVDLTDAASERIAWLQALAGSGALAAVGTLAFYSHVEVDVREQAQAAGLDLVVPRSRMAREAAVLAGQLADAPRRRPTG